MLSQKARYALRALQHLADSWPETGLTPLAEIAAAQNIPPKFLTVILSELVREGLVVSTRGRDGGYRLARPPEEVTYGDVVRVRGVEVELVASPADWLSFYVNAAYTDARYVDFADAPCPIEFTGGPQVCHISGGELPGVSRWAAAFGGEGARPVSTAAQVYFGVDGSYRSSFSSNPSPSPFVRIAGHALVSLRAGVRTDTGWNAFAWVRNLTDAEYFDFLSVQPGGSGLIVGQPGDPRTWGVTVGKRWR